MKLEEIKEQIQENMYTNIKNEIKLLEINWNGWSYITSNYIKAIRELLFITLELSIWKKENAPSSNTVQNHHTTPKNQIEKNNFNI